MDRIVVLLAGLPAATEVKLRSAVQEADFETLSDQRRADALHAYQGSPAIVGLGGDLDEGFRLVRDLTSAGLLTIVVGPTKDADLILRAMREGAKEFLLAGDDGALVEALRGIVKPQRAAGIGPIYAVFPAKGGLGATTVATNFAGALQAAGSRTCLVDLNLNMGDVLAFLDLAGGFSIADLLANVRRLDRDLLEASLLQHRSGVHVVTQSHRIEESDRIDAAAVGTALAFLRQHYDAVVVDGLRSFDEISVAALDLSEQILLLVSQEVPAVRDAKRCVDLFRRLGAESKLKLIVNRFQRGPEINAEVIAETVGIPVSATVANDYPAVIGAVNKGVLLQDSAPRAQVTRDLDALRKVVGHASAGTVREQHSILSRFFGLRGAHAT